MAAKLKNCSICGKIFMSNGEKICPNCMKDQEDMELVVVEYVRDHPKCKIPEIMEATGAQEFLIRRLIDEGRFVQAGVNFSYPCQKCGKPIITGKYCEDCLKEMQENLQSVQTGISKAAEAQAAAERGHGMYSKDLKDLKRQL